MLDEFHFKTLAFHQKITGTINAVGNTHQTLSGLISKGRPYKDENALKVLKAIDIFGEWAKEGRDVGMEKAHEISVNEMIDFALEERSNIGERFSFFDLGCGNGWVVRKVARSKLCNKAVGIDGAKQIIVNA